MLGFKKNNTVEGQARQLARHYPSGRVWVNTFKPGSNIGKMVTSLAREWLRSEAFAAMCVDELDINQTTALIEKWEESVGIPDALFSNTVDINMRRLQVLQRLIDFGGAQTLEDFQEIAALFGFAGATIIVSGAGRVFPLTFPLSFSTGGGVASKSTVYVILPSSVYVFPMPFPLLFSANSGLVLEGIFRSLFPANVDIVFTFGEPTP